MAAWLPTFRLRQAEAQYTFAVHPSLLEQASQPKLGADREHHVAQCFGERTPGEDIQEADIISAIEFDRDGMHLATGDRGGRVVLFERTPLAPVRETEHPLRAAQARASRCSLQRATLQRSLCCIGNCMMFLLRRGCQ